MRSHRYSICNKILSPHHFRILRIVLEWDQTRAEVTELYADRLIHIRVQGRNRKGLMSIIDKTFDELHADFSGIEVEKMIPCNCEGCTAGNRKRHFFRYSQLRDMKEDQVPEIQCGEKPYKMVNVLRLIDDVFVTDLHSEQPPAKKIFISYAQADEAYLQDLKKQLSPIQRQGILRTWDVSQLMPGEEGGVSTRRELQTAGIILLLVSSDFMANEEVWNEEMKSAMERHEKDETVVIPIIIRPSLWQEAPFAKFKALPANGVPVSSWSNTD